MAPENPEGPATAPAGWYPQPDGRQLYWDGQRWLDIPAPGAAATPVTTWNGDESDPEYQAELAKARAEAKADSRRGWVVIIAVVLVAGLAFAFWPRGGSRSASSNPPAVSALVDVVYKVEGTASGASITIATATGTEQADIGIPLRNKNTGVEGLRISVPRGTFVYISAQNSSDSGTVECIIEVDGVPISRNSSNADYGIASCEGTA